MHKDSPSITDSHAALVARKDAALAASKLVQKKFPYISGHTLSEKFHVAVKLHRCAHGRHTTRVPDAVAACPALSKFVCHSIGSAQNLQALSQLIASLYVRVAQEQLGRYEKLQGVTVE